MLNTLAHKKSDEEHRAVLFVKANTFTIYLFSVNMSCGNPIIEKDTNFNNTSVYLKICIHVYFNRIRVTVNVNNTCA